jgi:gluconokinase
MNLVLMGVAGSGKTTVGRRLAARLGGRWRFDDADDFHPPTNIDKMSRGIPLTDADRAPWLDALGAHLAACAARGEPVVLACSALKEAYRRRLATASGATHFVYLKSDFAAILARLQNRRHHYLKAALLRSQFAALEEPAPGTALVVDAALPPDEIVARILAELEGRDPAQDSSPRLP